ncbi:MAG: RdgB/HAM1 family non-canonical purine NTP pyrophosphatase [Clostridiales Family XIII bacterium]|jgi:XTP/dITP diphosphohydrolase|nr:RdgB/HAM1 family non-canonical purine NTP pyrophosphatase [Clostridiales Family XIII bacterium]
MIVVTATGNAGKAAEMAAILGGLGLRVMTRGEAGAPDLEVEEDGDSFEANALKKALAVMRACGRPSLADDSGLEADALAGAPGVLSARFAGVSGAGADAANNRRLLELMSGVPDEKRTGRFVCVVTLALPDGRTLSARGECEGRIGRAAAGSNGFGYDPLFTPAGFGSTFAELPAETKNAISHRSKALLRLKDLLVQYLIHF